MPLLILLELCKEVFPFQSLLSSNALKHLLDACMPDIKSITVSLRLRLICPYLRISCLDNFAHPADIAAIPCPGMFSSWGLLKMQGKQEARKWALKWFTWHHSFQSAEVDMLQKKWTCHYQYSGSLYLLWRSAEQSHCTQGRLSYLNAQDNLTKSGDKNLIASKFLQAEEELTAPLSKRSKTSSAYSSTCKQAHRCNKNIERQTKWSTIRP